MRGIPSSLNPHHRNGSKDYPDLRSIAVSEKRKKDRILERLAARCKRLIHRGPVVVPNPNEPEYTALLDEASPFQVKCSSIVEFSQYVTENADILSERERFEKSLIPKKNYLFKIFQDQKV